MKKKDIFAVLVTGSFMLFPTFIHASSEEAALTNHEVQAENTTSQTTAASQAEATDTLNAYKNDVDKANISLEEKQPEVNAIQAEINAKKEETDALKNIADASYNDEVAEKKAALDEAAENLSKASEDLETAKDEQENLKQAQEKAHADYELKKEIAETAQKDLVNAEKEADGLTQADVDTAKKTLDKTTSDLESAQSDTSKKQETYDSALVEYKSATTTESEKQAAYDIASSELATATSTYDTALAEYEAISKQVTDAGINENTSAEYEAVTSRLEEAQKALTSAKSELVSAQSDLSDAQSNLTSAQNNLSWAEYQLKMAKDNVNTAQSEVDTAKSDLATAEAEQEKANQANTAAQADLASAKSEYDIAKANLDTAKATLDAANEAAEKGEDKTELLQKAYDDAVAKYNLGSLGYFYYIDRYASNSSVINDVEKAIEIIKDTNGSTQNGSTVNIIGAFTNLGAENDATNLENMKIALENVIQGNNLRWNNGLNNLKITNELMAIAQKQLNWSKSTLAHSQAYDVAENLAWGYTDSYVGWYDEEKVIYDQYIANGDTLETIKADDEKYSTVGHYLNIIESSYKTTGFAHVEGSDVLYDIAESQTFDTNYGGVTVYDYYESFMKYYNELKSDIATAKSALDKGGFTGIATAEQLKAVQEAQNAYYIAFDACMYADSEYTWAQNVATDAANTLTSANDAVDTAYTTLTNANNNLTSAQFTQRLKEEILADADDALLDANSALTAAQSKVDDAQKKVTDEQNNVDEIQKLYKYYASIDFSLLDKLEVAKQTLDSATTSKTTAEINEATAKSELDTSKASTTAKKSAKDSAEEALKKANTTQTSAQTAYDNASTDYTDKNARYSVLLSAQQVAENAKHDLESAFEKSKNAVATYESQQKLVEQLEEALNTAQTDKDTAQANYNTIIQANVDEDPVNNEVAAYLEQKAILQNLLNELNDLLAQLDEKQAQYDQAKDDYEAYAAYYDLMINTPADYSKIDVVTKEFEQIDQNLYEEKGIQNFVNYHMSMDSDLNSLEQNKADQYADDLQKLYDALTLKSADYNNLEAAQKKAEAVFEDIYTQDSLKMLRAKPLFSRKK
jgi:peptidoglycan hydrolase CwlO-like protein